MTPQEWKQRSAERILKAVRKAGRMRIRDLKRATHYSRGPGDEGPELWLEALDYLEKKKLVVIGWKRLFEIEGDEELGLVIEFVMTPQAAESPKGGLGVAPYMAPYMAPVDFS
jgi:hypothetical protein